MPVAPKKSSKEADSPPDVERHDEVYFRHAGGPAVGKVLSRGKHGCVIDAAGRRHKVKWAHLLGHKVRIQPNVTVVDQGEDGMLVADAGGRTRYIHDPVPSEPASHAPIRKSLAPTVLFFAAREDLAKAIANRPGLTLQAITDKAGHQTKRWKRTMKPEKKTRDPAAAEAGAGSGYGTHNLATGDKVSFGIGDLKGDGKIVGDPGPDGAHVKDSSGHEHKVLWSQITGHQKPERAGRKTTPPSDKAASPATVGGGSKTGGGGSIPPDKFNAAGFARENDDPSVTVESILAQFPPDTAAKIQAVQQRLMSVEQTIATQKKNGRYVQERLALHRQILYTGMTKKVMDEDTGEMVEKHFPGLLSPEAVAAATPADGEQPTFSVLGGRGGSGKSWFKNKVYDPSKAIVLDADYIKGMLPEYEGWNAAQVHEESGELFDLVTGLAQTMGLNIVHDATMKSPEKATALVGGFKKSGYRVEAHYMHLPRQEAAKRAVQRFLGKTERYVPVEIVLGMQTNEQSFDGIRDMVDAWSFRDNNVPRGQEPKLISSSEGSVEKA